MSLLTTFAGPALADTHRTALPAQVNRAAAAPSFTFHDYQVPGSTDTDVLGFGPNGEIVGSYSDAKGIHGFTRSSAGVLQTLNVPASLGASTQIVAASGSQLLVQVIASQTQSYVRNSAGQYTAIAVPGALSTQAWGMNNAGTIVGYYTPKSNQNLVAAFTYAAGKYSTFQIPGSPLTLFTGINNSGVICGSYELPKTYSVIGFTLTNGKLSTIAYPGSLATYVNGINDSGEVVGYLYENSGFVYQNGKFTTFLFGVGHVRAQAIDASGDIAGSFIPLYTASEGFTGQAK